jgi:sulfate/thiosulfate-binding protein
MLNLGTRISVGGVDMRRKTDQSGAIVTIILVMIVVVILAEAARGCQSGAQATRRPVRRTIEVRGFSVEEEVMTEELFPAFQEYWQDKTGQEVVFRSTFASSEEITEQILNGALADVAILSNAQHATWLCVNNLVETGCRDLPHEGVISRSPIVIAVRPGNPLRIESWADLARPGVRLIHPDPRTSGGAQWALVAEYGAGLFDTGSGSQEAAAELLHSIWANVVASPPSARDALKQFLFGAGDALVTYEQDALLAQARGATLDIVVPHSTAMSEHVAVIVDRNVQPHERDVVEAFVEFLWSDEAQEALTHYYFRAVTDEALNMAVPEFHRIERPFTVQDLGGWAWAYPEVINRIWEEQIRK